MFYFWMVLTIKGIILKEDVLMEIIITAVLGLIKNDIKKHEGDSEKQIKQ